MTLQNCCIHWQYVWNVLPQFCFTETNQYELISIIFKSSIHRHFNLMACVPKPIWIVENEALKKFCWQNQKMSLTQTLISIISAPSLLSSIFPIKRSLGTMSTRTVWFQQSVMIRSKTGRLFLSKWYPKFLADKL